MLKVTVAEVSRSIIKQLGIDLSANLTYGTAVVNFSNSNPLTALGHPLVGTNSVAGNFGKAGNIPSVTATLRAMESAGVVRDAGRTQFDRPASGEIRDLHRRWRVSGSRRPFLRVRSRSCSTSISFKKFGISLNFTPVNVLTRSCTHQPGLRAS